jgi:hypothetical protein
MFRFCDHARPIRRVTTLPMTPYGWSGRPACARFVGLGRSATYMQPTAFILSWSFLNRLISRENLSQDNYRPLPSRERA